MGAEIFDVEINFDGVVIAYATKVSSKKNKYNNTTLTFNGDVTTSGKNTGGTISIERLVFPTNVDDVVLLENKLDEAYLKVLTCTGVSYTKDGQKYQRTITGTEVTITSDEEEWSPSDGITHKMECSVNSLVARSERI